MDIGMEIDRIKTDRDRFTEGRTNILVNYVRGCKTWTMEVVRRSRNNSEKQPCFGNQFLQLESHKNERDRVSFQILYPMIYSNDPFKSLRSC